MSRPFISSFTALMLLMTLSSLAVATPISRELIELRGTLLQQGKDAYAAREYERARELFQRADALHFGGSCVAKSALAIMDTLGRGAPANQKSAAVLVLAGMDAAEFEPVNNEFTQVFGSFSAKLSPFAEDYGEAVRRLRWDGAWSEDPDELVASVLLKSTAIGENILVPAPHNDAEVLVRAFEKGSIHAAYLLGLSGGTLRQAPGLLMEEGSDLDIPDKFRLSGAAWLALAAKKEHAPSMREYGLRLLRGDDGAAKNPAEGKKWLVAAAQRLDPKAILALATYFLGWWDSPLPSDPAEACFWFAVMEREYPVWLEIWGMERQAWKEAEKTLTEKQREQIRKRLDAFRPRKG
jgi:TPR repeat protein